MFRSATTRIAHKSAIFASLGGNKDLQVLQSLIDLEKNIAQSCDPQLSPVIRTRAHPVSSLQRLASDYDRAAEAMRVWGSGEGEDLSVRSVIPYFCILRQRITFRPRLRISSVLRRS
jgi:hypothetical protein